MPAAGEEPSPSGSWEVWRQDDNGVRLLVGRFPTREAAEARIAGFESHHHKQTYWVERRDGERG